ncbi:hypothetical protein DICPUDRAFT_90447 [Dictyostelium purpureum]|uniref:C2 domain-containing protein n=1 Tax=Dictyostelium purpureum TaxID=5786 RepID=F1A2N9_DICPU|nr:uncharacterized protein DICPUDRAFT_90447 [Dictyostelium purpureum]EGC29544.1 hypothetical protein DICPUDRAFT_90447 [Dictyostelium purpureum]|eukprot:XP_003293934.1 hypothetical protein DICPUDRAFT_90447 [Dictyostelium purpureum]
MSIYNDIIKEQTKKGNLGGKKGPLGDSGKKDSNKSRINFFIITGKVEEAHDSNGLADPFVRIGKKDSDGKVKWILKTPVKKETLSPSWSYETNEDIDLNEIKTLVVEMHDKDLLSSDFIGEATIDISDLENNDILYETIQLYNKKKDINKPSASVYLSIKKN